MSLYGFNRAALNGGVSGIVAGAAMFIASSSFAADGTRWVLPTAAITASSSTQANGRLALQGVSALSSAGKLTATGVRKVYGLAGFVTESSGTAFPALLQLVTADIVVTSGLRAIYTNAWALSNGGLKASGFITQNGAAAATSTWSTTVNPLVIAGFASNLSAYSSLTADASVRLSGQSTWIRDGYALAVSGSNLTANGLKTALGYSAMTAVSDCTAKSIKIHGGRANFESVWTTSAIASTDAGKIVVTSDFTATALVTRHADALLAVDSILDAEPTLTTFAQQVDLIGSSAFTSEARLALLGDVIIVAQSDLTAAPRLAALGLAVIRTDSAFTALGTIYKMGEASLMGNSGMTAQWALLIESSADIPATSGMTALPYTNAEAPDPEARTMYRLAVDRVMCRAFNDRNMRR